MAKFDWTPIKSEYIRTRQTYRELAEKYCVSYSSLSKVAADNKWKELRDKVGTKRDDKIAESIASKEAKRFDDIQSVADLLVDKIKSLAENDEFVLDPRDLRAVVAALKDLKDIKGCKSELDMQEQIARIDKLRKETQREEESKDIRVVIEGDLDAFSI